MSELKATPGPWKISTGHSYIAIITEGIPNVTAKVVADMRSVGGHCNEADAHLTAAAPELYEKLAKYVALVEDDSSEDFLYEFKEIVALLAKARGGSQ